MVSLLESTDVVRDVPSKNAISFYIACMIVSLACNFYDDIKTSLTQLYSAFYNIFITTITTILHTQHTIHFRIGEEDFLY